MTAPAVTVPASPTNGADDGGISASQCWWRWSWVRSCSSQAGSPSTTGGSTPAIRGRRVPPPSRR